MVTLLLLSRMVKRSFRKKILLKVCHFSYSDVLDIDCDTSFFNLASLRWTLLPWIHTSIHTVLRYVKIMREYHCWWDRNLRIQSPALYSWTMVPSHAFFSNLEAIFFCYLCIPPHCTCAGKESMEHSLSIINLSCKNL